MSIEKSLERIAIALETMAANSTGDDDTKPPPKPTTTKRKKKEETPAPQPDAVDDPPSTEVVPIRPDTTAEKIAEEMSPEDLNKGLMDLAKGAAPSVVQDIFKVLSQVGAANTAEVPPERRAWVLAEATKVVKAHG